MSFKQPHWYYVAFIIFFCLLSKQMNAQLSDGEIVPVVKAASYSRFSVGFEIGYNKNYLLTNVSDLISTEYASKNGISIGIPILYNINDCVVGHCDFSRVLSLQSNKWLYAGASRPRCRKRKCPQVFNDSRVVWERPDTFYRLQHCIRGTSVANVIDFQGFRV